MSALLTATQRAQMLANGQRSWAGYDSDVYPVVKLFTPDAQCTWLLTEIDPIEQDRAFGLCDLGAGFPELGYVSLRELATVRGQLGLPIERDRHFKAKAPLSTYHKAAWKAGHIVETIGGAP